MNIERILQVANSHRNKFVESIRASYELRGVLTSEALLMCAITKELGVSLLVESGRARGYSTQLFADFFEDSPEFKTISIDYDKFSSDTKYSEQNLKPYSNVSLLYGDAFKLLPKQTTEDCAVFIDGPKGSDALLLAGHVLENPKVKVVFIHDLHKSTFDRNICETIFINTFFSDHPDFVRAHRDLDNACWEMLQQHGEAPYVRKHKPIASYGSTVAVIFNSTKAHNQPAYSNFVEYYAQLKNTSFKDVLRIRIAQHPRLAYFVFGLYNRIRHGK